MKNYLCCLPAFLLLAGSCEWLTAAEAWQPVGLSGGGGMFSPAISPVDPDLMMVNCDMSAAYLSENGGRDWRMIHHAQLRADTRCRPCFHPKNPDVVYASSRGRLKVSRDRGHTFTELGDLEKPIYGEIAVNAADPDFMMVGTRDAKCSRSADGGRTWSPCAGPRGDVIRFHFDQTQAGRTVFVATDQGIWRSEDHGVTWQSAVNGLPWPVIQGFAGGSNAEADTVRLYCSVESRIVDGKFAGGLYVSLDGARTWQSAMGQGTNTDTRRADRWSYGDISQYSHLLTTDREPMTVYAANTSTGFHPPHHDTVFRSDDGGATWRDVYFMDPRFDRYNVAPNYVTASTGQSYKGGDAPFGMAIGNGDPNRLILVRSRCYVTHNGGETWFNADTRPPAGVTPQPGSPWVCTGLVVTTTWHYYIDPFQTNRHYIAYTDIGWARSLDSGKTWAWWDKVSWAPWRNTCYEVAFDPTTAGKMWGAFSDVHDIPNDNIISERHGHDRPGGVAMSRDFGRSWQVEAKGLPPKPVTSIVLDSNSPVDARVLYAGVFGEGVFKSTDNGRSWVLKREGLGHEANRRVSRVSLHKDGSLFALICAKRPAIRKPLMREGVGLYRSANGGEHWEKVNHNQEFLYPKDFSVSRHDSRVILLGTCDKDWYDKSGGLYLTTDGGHTWRRIGREGRQTFGGYFHPDRKGWIYMTLTEGAPGAGLWLSRDWGATWLPFTTLPFSNIQRVVLDPTDPTTLYVTTFGGSVWKGPAVPVDTK